MADSSFKPNVGQYTVTEISQALKHTVEQTYGYVRVRGEISGLKQAPSGHVYLNLKDDQSVLASVCWRGTFSQFSFKAEDGLEVIASGKLTTYAGQSKYQLVIEAMEPSGTGALMALLEKRKAQFQAEGLFDAAHKKPLPVFPRLIGIVTSPTGAVIQDILHRLEERFPVRILLAPVLVQGVQAADQIAAAIAQLNKQVDKPDVIIVARGGGSLEDLWPFNEEIVVRAVFASQIPVVSAVGHETDVTLIDFVADLRAPTPTAAAEMVTPVRRELLLRLGECKQRLDVALHRLCEQKHEKLMSLVRILARPGQLLDDKIQRLDHLSFRLQRVLPVLLEAKHNRLNVAGARLIRPDHVLRLLATTLQEKTRRMGRAYQHCVEQQEQQLETLSKLLESYHYQKTLQRGFALVTQGQRVISSVQLITPEKSLTVEWHDGKQEVTLV